MKRVYISGPMTGLPDFNYPAFNAAAQLLRSEGIEVENPAENPTPECRSWAGYMRLALVQICRCDAVLMLPGWEKSKGARLELHVAQQLGLQVRYGSRPLKSGDLIASAGYLPEVRALKGMQSLLRPSMSAICDVCGKSRTRRGGHDECSKIRQTAGFIIEQETTA